MTTGNSHSKPELTLIRGGKASAGDFESLPLTGKIAHLREAPARKKLALILGDPDGKQLTQALRPEEIYRTIMEIGPADAQELIKGASPEQREFLLDMELWERSTLSPTKSLEWLGHLLDAGEETIAEQLPYLDIELLLAILIKEITVGGGVGDLTTDDERTATWDHTFDNLYYITFKNPNNSKVIGRLIDIIHRHDHHLYAALLEGVKNEVEIEMEEEAYRLRAGRLADHGFPSREEAVYIYARIDPASFVQTQEKKVFSPRREADITLPFQDDTLLARALRRAGSEELFQELAYLINNALVVEETPFTEGEAMQTVMQRVSGYLTIALEFLCGDSEEQVAATLGKEPFRRLFQLGHSIVQGLKKRAVQVTGTDYATGKALNGLMAERPRYYRGLDKDGIDGYREFAGMEDVRKVEAFLKMMEEPG